MSELSLFRQRTETNRTRQHMIAWLGKHPLGLEHFTATLDSLCEPVAKTLNCPVSEILANLAMEPIASMVRGITSEECLLVPWIDKPGRPLDNFVAERGRREKRIGRSYLRALGTTSARIWEIVEIDPGYSVTVRRLNKDGQPPAKPRQVHEITAGTSMYPGQCVLARVLQMPEGPIFSACLLPISREQALPLLDQPDESLVKMSFSAWAYKTLSSSNNQHNFEYVDV